MRSARSSSVAGHEVLVAVGLLLGLAEESAGLAAALAALDSAENVVVDCWASARWGLLLVIAAAFVVQQHWQPVSEG